jgi:hypothetical protein
VTQLDGHIIKELIGGHEADIDNEEACAHLRDLMAL